jgi:hypothetical protein
MSVPPWVIEQMEQERLRQEEDERRRSQRIELPQTIGEAPNEDDEDGDHRAQRNEPRPPRRVEILDISPRTDGYPI